MSSYIYKSDLKAEYFYNGIGQRVLKKFHNKHGVIWNYQFTYNAQGQMIHYAAFSDGNHSSQRWEDDIVWLNNKPVAVSRSYHDDNAQNTHDLLYVLSDHLNTPRKLTDATGTVLWSWNSDAFGTTAPDQDVDGDGIKTVFHLRFSGQYFDFETKQHYNYFRDYEPGTGRYLESDPIGLQGGWNTFSYVMLNPIIYSDTFGLEPINFGTNQQTHLRCGCYENCQTWVDPNPVITLACGGAVGGWAGWAGLIFGTIVCIVTDGLQVDLYCEYKCSDHCRGDAICPPEFESSRPPPIVIGPSIF